MARALVDLSQLDLSRNVMSENELREIVPHTHEFQMLDGVCHLDVEKGVVVGYKDFDEEPWWARGHIPGRPLLPGVLMVEGCAQVSTILMRLYEGWGNDRFIGLGGLEKVRFRGQVVPPARVHFVSIAKNKGRRIPRYPAQTYLHGKMIMEMGRYLVDVESL